MSTCNTEAAELVITSWLIYSYLQPYRHAYVLPLVIIDSGTWRHAGDAFRRVFRVMGQDGREVLVTVCESNVTLRHSIMGILGVTGCWVTANERAACTAVQSKTTR